MRVIKLDTFGNKNQVDERACIRSARDELLERRELTRLHTHVTPPVFGAQLLQQRARTGRFRMQVHGRSVATRFGDRVVVAGGDLAH